MPLLHKRLKRYHGIKLFKNKIDLNNGKIKNHSASPNIGTTCGATSSKVPIKYVY